MISTFFMRNCATYAVIHIHNFFKEKNTDINQKGWRADLR